MVPSVVLITGSSSGIGHALCHSFADRGFRVVATARRPESLKSLAAQGMATLPLDVTSTADIQAAIAAVLEQEGRLDVLVNNAGYGLFGPLLDISPSALEKQFHTNVFAPLAIIQAVAPIMKRQGQGLILNIGSISGVITTPFAGAYCGSKAALHALSDALRMELAPFGIRVVTVQPGAIASNFGNAARSSLPPESWYLPLANQIQGRANFSQVDATPAQEFSDRLLDIALRPHPPAIIRLGKKSLWLPLLRRLLPLSWLDRILTQRFGLADWHP